MSPDQLQLVRLSWARLQARATVVAARLYDGLFAQNPALRALFSEPPEAVGVKLMHMLDSAIHCGAPSRPLQAVLLPLGLRHAGYGVRPAHYEIMGRVLMEVLQDELGDDFRPLLREAWIALFAELSLGMLLAERRRAA